MSSDTRSVPDSKIGVQWPTIMQVERNNTKVTWQKTFFSGAFYKHQQLQLSVLQALHSAAYIKHQWNKHIPSAPNVQWF